jgi:glycerol-3-phosphate dehydrogenase subunit B
MNHDAIVVGAGLAGLTAGLRLAQSGRRVLVLAKGVGATHLAPATIDVLGYLDGRVERPATALNRLAPEHPYKRLGRVRIQAAVEWLRTTAPELGYVGELGQNFLLPTAVGAVKPSAVVPETMARGDLRSGGRFAVVGFRGLKDFYPAYLADNLEHAAPVRARALELDPRDGEGDVSALGLAARFEEPDFRRFVVDALRHRVMPGERVGFPAVLGLRNSHAVWRELEEALRRPVFEVPTLPPSVSGIRLFEALKDSLRRAGGRLVVGDEVVGAERTGGRVAAVVGKTAARTVTYRARNFVLATGGFASGGLELDSFGAVRELVFGLPLTCLPAAGEPRFAPGYFDRHAIGRVGVGVDERLRPTDLDGRALYENLHAAGAILAGAEPWKEASGNGISLATGFAAAEAILEEEKERSAA